MPGTRFSDPHQFIGIDRTLIFLPAFIFVVVLECTHDNIAEGAYTP